MHKIKRILFFIVSFSMVTLLSACGSKGDLYHDDKDANSANETQKDQQEESQPQKQEQ